MLSELKPPPQDVSITYGDGSKSEVLGLGKVVVTPDVSIVDIMLVKTLSYNLLSVLQLANMGFESYFTKLTVVLLWEKTLSVAFVGHVEHGLYVVDFSKKKPAPTATCLMARADKGWLWHRRLAHVNMRALHTLHKGGHVKGLKDVKFVCDRVCSACFEGKGSEAPHKKKTYVSSKRILELLHMDLFGPESHTSLGGKKYCLVIVDDYSRYSWVYFFKLKSETQQTVKDFTTQIQREHNKTIIAIRSDNGTEFKNYTLEEFLSDEGINVTSRS